MNALRLASGGLLVGGFSGTSLPDSFARALANGERAGAILFARNLLAREGEGMIEGVLGLNSAIAAAARASGAEVPAPIIAVDQEGGRVARLGAPALRVPPLRRLATAQLSEDAIEAIAYAQGAELAALGFTMNFAPVLDVDSNPANPIIGDRSFGADPETVARLGIAYARGLKRAGVLACGKHFPGHGDTALDSHLALPRVDGDRARLDRLELLPFAAAARDGMDAFMTAHVVFSALDAERPATLSPRIATRLVRDELGFRGVLISDDLEMKAVSERAPVGELACEAIAAGCDLLLVCSREDAQVAAFEALVRRAEADSAFRARVDEANRRVLDMRTNVHFRPVLDAIDRAAVFARSQPVTDLLAPFFAATATATAETSS